METTIIKDELRILDCRLPLREAIEASSVLWENLAVKPSVIFERRVIVVAFIAIFLIFISSVFTYIKSFAGNFIEKYSSSVNCEAIHKNFDNN